MKKSFALILVCLLALASMPALAETSDVSGDWYADLGGAAARLTLASDGTYIFAFPGRDAVTGIWTPDDGYICLDGSAIPELYVDGETLCMVEDTVFFTREQPEIYVPGDVRTDLILEMFAGYWKPAFVDVNGTPVPAAAMEDETDLYVEGTHAILGGPVLGDTIVALTFADGVLSSENDGVKVLLQYQQDGYLRLTVAGTDTAPQTWYLISGYSPVLDEEDQTEGE